MDRVKRATAVGVFSDHASADHAVVELKKAGFRDDQIGVTGKDWRPKGTAKETGNHAGEGAAVGIAAGAGAGALVGLGVLSGIIPVIGPAIAAGTLGVILSNAAGGAAIAGLVGALIGMGVPEDEAKLYQEELESGRFIVTVKADGRFDDAMTILRRHGGYERSNMMTNTATAANACASNEAGQKIQLHEEELHARKQPVQTGEVRVRKEVHTEHKTLEVPVQKEEVVIERRPASGTAAASSIRAGEEIRIPVMEEQVRVEKTPVVKEEVTVGKRTVQENQQVAGTVRKEELRVEESGNVDVHACGTPSSEENVKNRKKRS